VDYILQKRGEAVLDILIIYGLLGVVVIFLLLVIIGRVVAAHSLRKVQDLREEIEQNSQFRRKEEPQRPHNDFRARDREKEAEEQKRLETGVTVYDPQGLRKQELQEQTEIVGLAEPQGFWSKFIMSQKLGFLMARMNANKKGSGFWVNLIKAQGSSQSREQGRGR
jgi:hypothetical protein